MLQQRCPALEQARQSHRANTSVALQHLHQGVLDGEPDDLLALLTKDLRHGLQDTALTSTCYALDGDRPVGRGEDQPGSGFLSVIEVDACPSSEHSAQLAA